MLGKRPETTDQMGATPDGQTGLASTDTGNIVALFKSTAAITGPFTQSAIILRPYVRDLHCARFRHHERTPDPCTSGSSKWSNTSTTVPAPIADRRHRSFQPTAGWHKHQRP